MGRRRRNGQEEKEWAGGGGTGRRRRMGVEEEERAGGEGTGRRRRNGQNEEGSAYEVDKGALARPHARILDLLDAFTSDSLSPLRERKQQDERKQQAEEKQQAEFDDRKQQAEFNERKQRAEFDERKQQAKCNKRKQQAECKQQVEFNERVREKIASLRSMKGRHVCAAAFVRFFARALFWLIWPSVALAELAKHDFGRSSQALLWQKKRKCASACYC
ncbi:hypothetical protein EV122DRAFT_254539 [Schizophyllum commune]